MTELTHPFDNNDFINKSSNNKQLSPPSPKSSQDDLMRDLAVGISPVASAGLLSPKQSPKTQTLKDNKQDEIVYKMYTEFIRLVYWEIPGRSGIILGSVLSSLILTRYYSLLYLSAAALTIMTGFNLIFVNAYTSMQSIWSGLPLKASQHPYLVQIKNPRFHLISRDLLECYVCKSADVMEVFIHKIVTVVLVEDPKLTGIVFCISFIIYYITSFIPTKAFFVLFIVGLFSIPYYYDQHQERVDSFLLQLQLNSQTTVDKYITIVQKSSGSVYKQALVVCNAVNQQIRSVSKNCQSKISA